MIISCGEALVDILPGGVPVPGGGPMNAAIAAARLGVPTAFCGRISTDEAGRTILAHLESSNVDLRLLQQGEEPTARAVVETEPVQRFVFHGEGTADQAMDPVDLGVLDLHEQSGPHVLHGGTLGIFRGRTADVLAHLAEGFDGIVSFDPNIRPAIIEQVGRDHWWSYADRWLARADLVRGSDEDFGWMELSVSDLLDRGPKVVIETRGADGAVAHLASGDKVEVAAASIEFVDAVGAGDSFCGAVLTRIATEGWPEDRRRWSTILDLAVTVAGITCSRPGADPPWAHELA